METRDYALIYLNGQRREIRGVESLMMLADWLRKEAGLTGTKIVCAEGDCGACTVLRAFAVGDEVPIFEAMNSCIATVAQLDGSHIVTVEGVQEGAVCSPVQEAMKTCHGSQCGYCTPGFVMALTAMHERHDQVDSKTAANYLTGNLCRCTGYQSILSAAVTAQASPRHKIATRYLSEEAVVALRTTRQTALRIVDGEQIFFAPTSLREAVTFTAKYPDARIVGATTDLGVQTNKGKSWPRHSMSLHLVDELYGVKETRTTITAGARVTLADLRRVTADKAPEFSRFLNIFASPQIKNVATLVGNVANASPIGDTLPFLLIAGGHVHLASRPDGKGPIKRRTVAMTEFYEGYKKLAMDPGEIITHISFEKTPAKTFLRLYKASQRKDLDISCVSGAFSLVMTGRGSQQIIQEAKIALGGVAATPVRLMDIEKSLVGGVLTGESVETIAQKIAKEIQTLSDARGTADYRRVLAANLFRRFASEVVGG